jgi:dynein heavy chain
MAKKNKNIVDSPESLWSYFNSNIRSNLHIVLCMSPAGDSLRVRCRKFPSLINCCTIDWFDSWTLEALTTVAKKFISEMNIEPENYKPAFTDLCTDSNLRMHSLC